MVTYIVTENNNKRPNINCSCQRYKPVPVVLAFHPGLLVCYQQFKPWSFEGSHNGAYTCCNSCGVNLRLVLTKFVNSKSGYSQLYTIYSM